MHRGRLKNIRGDALTYAATDVPSETAQTSTSRSQAMLSAENLHQLPDAGQNRLDALLTGHGNVLDDRAGKQLHYTHDFSLMAYRLLRYIMCAITANFPSLSDLTNLRTC
jgi:hypothetical protein